MVNIPDKRQSPCVLRTAECLMPIRKKGEEQACIEMKHGTCLDMAKGQRIYINERNAGQQSDKEEVKNRKQE